MSQGYEDEDEDEDEGDGPAASRFPRALGWGLAVVGLIAAVVIVALSMGPNDFRFEAVFGDAKGLKVGDLVYYRGAEVGEVASQRFDGDSYVATLAVRSDVAEQLRTDLLIYIEYDKILQEKKCISLIVLDPSSPHLQEGESVRGVDSLIAWFNRWGSSPVAIREMVRVAGEIRDFGAMLPRSIHGSIQAVLLGR